MEITVRLYKLHDYDLIYLQKVLKFPVKDAMKQAIAAYVRNDPVFFEVPYKVVVPDEEAEYLPIKVVQFHIKLDEHSDQDIIRYLSKIKKNYRNSYLKNLLRGYLSSPVSYVYETLPADEKAFIRKNDLEANILKIKQLKPLKRRKKNKKYVVLSPEQKNLFDLTGALNDVEVIINDKNSGKNKGY